MEIRSALLIFLIILIILFWILTEDLTQTFTAPIRPALLRKLVYWAIFICTRLCFCLTLYYYAIWLEITEDFPSPLHMRFRWSEEIYAVQWEYVGLFVLFPFSAFVWAITHIVLSFYSLIYLTHLKLEIGLHVHLPIRDIFQLIVMAIMRSRIYEVLSWGASVNGPHMVPYRTRCVPVITIDFDRTDDPAWPDCSFVHCIMIFICNGCTDENGLYLVTTSLLRNTTWTRYVGPWTIDDPASIDHIDITAIQSGGLIHIKISKNEEADDKHELFIHNLRIHKSWVVHLANLLRPELTPILVLPDNGSDWNDDQEDSDDDQSDSGDESDSGDDGSDYGDDQSDSSDDQSDSDDDRSNSDDDQSDSDDDQSDSDDDQDKPSIYLRVFYHDKSFPRTSFCHGHCLFRLSGAPKYNEIEQQDFEEIDHPSSWKVYDHEVFLMNNKIGIQVESIDITSNWEETCTSFLVYDQKSRKLERFYNLKPSLLTDLPLRLFGQRYVGCFDMTTLERLVPQYYLALLNDRQAVVVENNRTFWITRFQPTTLKFMCLRKIFDSYYWRWRLGLRGFKTKDWIKVFGVDLERHF